MLPNQTQARRRCVSPGTVKRLAARTTSFPSSWRFRGARPVPRPLAPFVPYTYQFFLVALIPLAFWLDQQTHSVAQQDVLGACAWLLLFAATRFSTPTERRQVWIMVSIATAVEIWSSIIWGIYRYRMGNLPMFVPPGHGLVYLFALRAARTPLVQRYPRIAVRGAVVVASAWALFGITLEPLLFHRLDVLGL